MPALADPDFFQAVDALSLPPPRRQVAPSSSLLVPGGVWADLLLTSLAPISHHDPATADKSNTLLFNRRKQLLPVPPEQGEVSEEAVDRLCAAHPVPGEIADLLSGVSLPEFAACCLVRLFLDLYNTGDGAGVFRGMDRYALLETRLRAAAVQSASLRGLWDRLCASLDIPIAPGSSDFPLLSLLSLPKPLQAGVRRAITEDFRSIVTLARLWSAEQKAQNEEYAKQSGREASAPSVTLSFAPELPGTSAASLVTIVDLPHVTGNSLRHCVVRGPGWRHLARRLGLTEGHPGAGDIPAGAEAVFENGGNIRAGAKQPGDPFGLAAEVRAAHPLLALLGGVTDSFDLGESRLHVGSWLVCRENAAALAGTKASDLPALTVSAFDLLDDVTHTRQATEKGRGQMIYNFETLCAGTQVLCRLHLAPGTSRLALGALAAAVETYRSGLAHLGGQKARGFGWSSGELLSCPDEWEECLAEYERYLDDHAEALRAGLVDGTLGARARVVS